MKRILSLLALACAAFTVQPASAATILIDDFRDANHFPQPASQEGYAIPLFTQSNPFVMEHTQLMGTILGGERDVEIRVNTMPHGVSAVGIIGDMDEGGPGTEGEFDFGSGAADRVRAILEYDGNDPGERASGILNNSLGLGGMNLANGNTGFLLMFRAVDAANGKTGIGLRVEVTGPGGTASFDGSIPESVAANYYVPYSSFNIQTPFAAATSIRFIFNGQANSDPAIDFNLKSIQAVPEPTTFALASIAGVCGLVTMVRRGRKN